MEAKQRDGPEVLLVSFETFFIQRSFGILCDFTFIWERGKLMERLQILAIGLQSIFEPSLRKLTIRLSTLVALLF